MPPCRPATPTSAPPCRPAAPPPRTCPCRPAAAPELTTTGASAPYLVARSRFTSKSSDGAGKFLFKIKSLPRLFHVKQPSALSVGKKSARLMFHVKQPGEGLARPPAAICQYKNRGKSRRANPRHPPGPEFAPKPAPPSATTQPSRRYPPPAAGRANGPPPRPRLGDAGHG